jgi:hypothetical protein
MIGSSFALFFPCLCRFPRFHFILLFRPSPLLFYSSSLRFPLLLCFISPPSPSCPSSLHPPPPPTSPPTVNHVPGLYAVRVIGRPPPEIIARIKRSGVPYIPRDDVAGDHTKQDEDDDEDEDEGDVDVDDYNGESGGGGRGTRGVQDLDEFEDDGMIVGDDEDEEGDERPRADDWKHPSAGRRRADDDGMRGELSEDDEDDLD